MGLKYFQSIFLWILLPIFSILVTLPCLLLFIYRFIVTCVLRRCFGPKNLGRPVSGLDFGFCADKFWSVPLGAIGGAHVIESPICANSVISRVNQVLTAADSKTEFERLTTLYPTFWLGYPFWTKNVQSEFKIHNHVKVLEAKDGPKYNINLVLKNWLSSAFTQNQPLWDVLIIPDYEDDFGKKRALFCFRIHHIIGDGYSIIKFLNKIFESPHAPSVEVKQQKQNFQIASMRKPNIFRTLRQCFFTPLALWNHFSPFVSHSDDFNTSKQNNSNSLSRVQLKLADLKTIRRQFSATLKSHVSLNTAILYLFGATLKEAIQSSDACLKTLRAEGPAKKLSVALALAKGTPRPDVGFRNHWVHAVQTVLVDTASELEALRKMVRNATSARKYAWVNGPIMSLHSLLPRCVYSRLRKNVRGTTIGMVNLPGNTELLTLCGKPVLEIYATIGLQLKNASFTLGCFSYNNKITITLHANQEVFTDDTAEKLLQIFKQVVERYLIQGIGSETNV